MFLLQGGLKLLLVSFGFFKLPAHLIPNHNPVDMTSGQADLHA